MAMYHPYFRGKQYELLCVKEMASVLRDAKFCPIIEPVREPLTGLRRTLECVAKDGGDAILVVNPHYGDVSDSKKLTNLLNSADLAGIKAGILLKNDTKVEEVVKFYEELSNHAPVFIHAGFTEAKKLAGKISRPMNEQYHIFFDRFCGKLYQKHFTGAWRVLLRDGFERRRNKDYDPVEPFSDLHATYIDEGMNGFGDFLIVGDEFSESGGPAYAVAIHLTFIDPDQDESMQIYHFKSVRQDTPQDPAGKFAEALDKLIETLDSPGCKVLETTAVKEFRVLHGQGHFPGLGYVKKLSMNHHIETLAAYFPKVPNPQ